MEFPSNVKYTKEHEWIRVEGDIADDSQRIWYETFFAVSQFMNTPTVYFLEQVDGEHRHQNGETVDYAQYYQFVLDGHDTKISEEKKQEKCHKRNHKRREYA
jgi:hypothetical protein